MGIISFSLWGLADIYNLGIVENVISIETLYPDYQIWIYIGRDIQRRVYNFLVKRRNVKLIKRHEADSYANSMWRFEPAFITDDIVLVRDADSRITPKEIRAVQEWLDSPYDFHIMRDHPEHTAKIMGGMWGCRNGILKKLAGCYNSFPKYNFYGVDQHFLDTYIYRAIIDTALIHTSQSKMEVNAIDFAAEYDDEEHIGAVITTAPVAISLLRIKNEVCFDKDAIAY